MTHAIRESLPIREAIRLWEAIMGALVTVTSFGIATVLSILLPLLIARFLLGGLFRSLLSVPKSPSGVNAGVKGQSAVGRT